LVNDFLEVENAPGIWAVGDCALVPDPLTNGFQPPTAQHASRQGRVLARNLVAEIDGTKKKAFRYSTLGMLAPIGRRTGVADVLGVRFSGFVAWWLWRTIYLFKLPRFEKKVRAALDWTLDLCFAKDFACITESKTKLAYSWGTSEGTTAQRQIAGPPRNHGMHERAASSE